jgi:hypothetical protein
MLSPPQGYVGSVRSKRFEHGESLEGEGGGVDAFRAPTAKDGG